MGPAVWLSVIAISASSPSTTSTSSAASAPEPSEVNGLGIGLTTAGLTTAVLLLGASAWWAEGDFGDFRFYREAGYFGRDTYAGGADKFGHAYSAYMVAEGLTAAYKGWGMEADNAAWVAAGFTFILFNGFEVIDGFDSQFGFEIGDTLMNTAGLALSLLQTLWPPAQEVVAFRVGYWPTQDFLANDRTLTKFINDYSGMTYHLDLKLKGVLRRLNFEPSLLDYGLIGLAFRSKNYSPIRRNALRQQLFGLHIGLSLPEILRVQSGHDKGVENFAKVAEYLSMPFLGVTFYRESWTGDYSIEFGLGARFGVGGP